MYVDFWLWITINQPKKQGQGKGLADGAKRKSPCVFISIEFVVGDPYPRFMERFYVIMIS